MRLYKLTKANRYARHCSVECMYNLRRYAKTSNLATAILDLWIRFKYDCINIGILWLMDLENQGIAVEFMLLSCIESEMSVFSV